MLGIVGLAMSVQVGLQLAARRSVALQAWSMLGLYCVSVGAFAYVGIQRARHLRRELAVLRELRSELE